VNWLAFFIGVLVGWMIEWLIDFTYWRRKWQVVQEEGELRRARLDAAQAEIRTLEKKIKKLESRLAPAPLPATELSVNAPELVIESAPSSPPGAESHVELAEADLSKRASEVESSGGEISEAEPASALHAPAALNLAAPHEETIIAAPTQPDDLVKIEGIGPRIAQLLYDNGILTFSQLAATPTDRLDTILRQAGPRFRLADPASWPEQARLASDGAWDQLKIFQDRLSAGRDREQPAH
jgi:predicted flap endonuclease-1-like 5' DNA nuclease